MKGIMNVFEFFNGRWKYIICGIFSLSVLACTKAPVIHYVDEFPNVRHPQILYWFWDDQTITGKQYLKDIDKMASQSPYDLVMLTSRFSDSVGFWNTEKMKPYLAEMVSYAHQKGIKIGLQLWPMNRVPELLIQDFSVNKEDAEALIAEGECTLDAKGRGNVSNKPISVRFNKIIHAGLLKIWLFKKTADGFYEASSLKEAENDWFTVKINPDFSADVSIAAPAEYSGYNAYVLTAHYYNFFDVMSVEHRNIFKTVLDGYSDIPFDGTALDENGNMCFFPQQGTTMTDRTWSDDFAKYYRDTCRSNPERLLLDMRYAPDNKPEIRIKAINTYFAERTKGAVQVEDFFYNYSKKLFGKDCFIGCHSTFHNSLTGVDVWTTGIDWWDLPREYGQTDEGFPMPDRMGVGISGTQPVMYNMFYNRNKETMLREALDNASFGVREHYHAWNDVQGWGKDVRDDDFLADVRPVESRIRLLNHFNPAPPELPLLIIYNFPYLFNWYPDKEQQNNVGIRQTDMQRVASSVWAAGYSCATVPSTWIEKGLLAVRDDGKVQIKDRVFDAVVFLYPQYARQSSFSFMKELLAKKGMLMIKGEATNDFDGNDCSALFGEIIRNAQPFDIEKINTLGVSKNPVPNGTFLQDGSVVMSDYRSVKEKKNTEFKIKIGDDEFTGDYEGVFAIKINPDGEIEKMVCGNFKSLKKNDETVLKIKTSADILLTTVKGKTVINVKGENNEIEGFN